MKILARLLIIIGCIILVGCNNQNVDSLEPTPSQPNFSEETEEEIIDENKEAINVYLFWGNGCHICENLMNYFEELEKEYGNYYNLIKYEVWYNEENSNLMHEVGNKLNQKIYRHHSGYIGGMKEVPAKVMLEKNPEKAMTLAVKGMLPHNSLGRKMAKKLRVYAGSEHENQAQKPEVWEVK